MSRDSCKFCPLYIPTYDNYCVMRVWDKGDGED